MHSLKMYRTLKNVHKRFLLREREIGDNKNKAIKVSFILHSLTHFYIASRPSEVKNNVSTSTQLVSLVLFLFVVKIK